NGFGVENDITYDLKDVNEVVDKISSETLVNNRKKDDKQLNDRFDKVLKKENLKHAWPTRKGLIESKEVLNIGCYQDGISVKRNEMLKEYLEPVKNDNSDSQFDLSRLSINMESILEGSTKIGERG
ncbi:20043_t:CDS:2, partial [Gigaspora margarita]